MTGEMKRRLEKLERAVESKRPAYLTVLFSDGTSRRLTPVEAIEAVQQGDIAGVTTDRADYAALAETLAAVFRE